MTLREITIGRSKNCDIYLDDRCRYASNMHATVYYDGNQMMYKDMSSNGTLINNVSVHKRAVPVNRGDTIMIAGKYPLNWQQIDRFFPYSPQQSVVNATPAPQPAVVPTSIQVQPDLSKWNWGAFFLSWIWGLFNGCWWILPIQLLLGILSIIPIVNIFTFIISITFWIYCGAKGTELAWNGKQWSSVQDFEHTQSIWAKVGIAWFCISLLLGVISTMILFAALEL